MGGCSLHKQDEVWQWGGKGNGQIIIYQETESYFTLEKHNRQRECVSIPKVRELQNSNLNAVGWNNIRHRARLQVVKCMRLVGLTGVYIFNAHYAREKQFSVMYRFVTLYRFVTVPFFSIPFCNSVPFCDVLFCDVPFCDVPYCDIPFRDVPYCDIPFRDVPFCDVPVCVFTNLFVLKYVIFSIIKLNVLCWV